MIEPSELRGELVAPLRRARRQVAAPRVEAARGTADVSGLQVRGNATAEEIAAVVAAVTTRTDSDRTEPRDPYARWRTTRFAALRRPR